MTTYFALNRSNNFPDCMNHYIRYIKTPSSCAAKQASGEEDRPVWAESFGWKRRVCPLERQLPPWWIFTFCLIQRKSQWQRMRRRLNYVITLTQSSRGSCCLGTQLPELSVILETRERMWNKSVTIQEKMVSYLLHQWDTSLRDQMEYTHGYSENWQKCSMNWFP